MNMRLRRGIALGLVPLAALLVAVSTAAEPAFVLDLPGGGRVPGGFAAMPAGTEDGGETLVWRSGQFVQPLEFRLGAIVGVRAANPVPAQPPAAEGEFRCRLRGGDVIDGDLVAIDTDQVVIARRGEPVRIRREQVVGIARRDGTASGYVGPGGLAGWQQRPESSWREEGGRIASDRGNSMVIRDLEPPRRARYDLAFSWQQVPELVVAIGRGAAAPDWPDGRDSFRFEILRRGEGPPEAMIARQDPAAGGLEPVNVPLEDRGRLRISLFIDLDVGRLAAIVGDADAVVELTVPPGQAASGEFRLLLRTGDVCLESIRVSEWRSPDPEVGLGQEGSVRLRGGRVVGGVLESFDEAARAVVIRTREATESIPLADLQEAALPAAEAGPDPEATVRLVLHAGGVLTGRLVAGTPESLTLASPAIVDPITVPLGDLRALTSLQSADPEPLPGRVGRLVIGPATLSGCVVNAADGGFAWRPAGGVNASPLAGGGELAAVVEYVESRSEPSGVARQLGGMGAGIEQNDEGEFVITMLSPDGAAAADGRIEPADRIVGVRPVEDGPMIATKGLELATVHDLVRGRVGDPVGVRVQGPDGGRVRLIELVRRPIASVEGGMLERALATHARLAAGRGAGDAAAADYPALVVLRSGDMVPAVVESIDERGVRIRSPVAAAGANEAVLVPDRLVKAIELDPTVEGRGISPARFERLLTLPRSQLSNPPTHLVRLRNGDYLRGRLESLDAQEVRCDVLGQKKRLPREDVIRLIWLHPEQPGDGAAAADDPEGGDPPPAAGLMVQGVAAGGERTTLVAERVEGQDVVGSSPAFGPARIDTTRIDRLVIGRAIGAGGEELPFSKWKLRPAPIPRALREDDEGG